MTLTDQYLEATRKVQENWFAAFDALNSQFSSQLQRPVGSTLPTVDAAKAVDEIFDFYGKALQVQRETAHKMLSASTEITAQWRSQMEQFQDAWREQAKVISDVTREQMESASTQAREQARSFGQSVEKQAATVKAAADDAARTVQAAAEKQVAMATEATEAAVEQTKRNYNLMNSAQLKAELEARKLLSTGTLDEMRKRLRDADKKA